MEVIEVLERVHVLRLWHVLITPGIWAPGHVCDGRANVAVRPEGPVELDVGASCDFSVQSSWRRSLDAALSVPTALEVSESYVLDWSVALDGARDALYATANIWVLVWLVEGVVFATDSRIAHVAVSGDGRGEGECGSNVLHC